MIRDSLDDGNAIEGMIYALLIEFDLALWGYLVWRWI